MICDSLFLKENLIASVVKEKTKGKKMLEMMFHERQRTYIWMQFRQTNHQQMRKAPWSS